MTHKQTTHSTQITYIHQHFKAPSENGGGRPYEFAARLAASGHQVTMFAAGNSARTYDLDGFTVVEIPTKYDNKMSVPRRILSFLNFMVRSTLAASRTNADIVLASSTPLTVAVPGLIASRIQKARFVLEVRDLWPKVPLEMGFLPKWAAPPAIILEKLAYRKAENIIALSPTMAAGIKAVDPYASVSLIPNAADIQAAPSPESRIATRRELGVPDDNLLFYYAGSLGVGYDPDWLAQLAVALEPHNATLVVLGDGAGAEKARQTVQSAGLQADTIFLGPRSRSQVFQVAAAADVAVSTLVNHPALEGNSLNKVFDAYAAGRPIIFNHDGWLADLTTSSGAGWRWPRELSESEIPQLLSTVVANTTKAGENSSRLAATYFDRELLFNKFSRVLLGQER